MVGVKGTEGYVEGAVIGGVFVRASIDGEVLPDSSPVYPLVETEPVTIEGVFSVVAKPTETSVLALTVNYNDNSGITLPPGYAHQVIIDETKRPNQPSKTVIDFTV